LEDADEKAKPVLEKALKEVGFIPNMYTNMVHSPALLDNYLHGYSLFRNESGLTPEEQEIVFLTISHENGCHYCVAAHSMLADKKSGVSKENIEAIRTSKLLDKTDLNELSSFTRTMVRTRGLPSSDDVANFLRAGYAEKNILDIILAIAVKTLSNYSNHVFHTKVDDMFSDYQ
jgi:uncharacterized peroxidase-related enzyme